MDAFRKQAHKLREQVSKQQQAVLKQFSGRFGNDSVITDEVEIQYYQQLKSLYSSTRSEKHFQKDLVQGLEDLICASLKQMEMVTKLAENCCRFGSENQSTGSALARVSLSFGTLHNMMEKEREILLEVLDAQVSEPLRTMIKGAPLEDACHLTRQYYRVRQEVKAQAAEVVRSQLKSKEAGATADTLMRLQSAESKLSALKSTLLALGKEATAAMMSVEVQQQRLTFERLLAMVDAERSYHQNAAEILDELHTEMVLEKQNKEPASQASSTLNEIYVPSIHGDRYSMESGDLGAITEKSMYFIAKAIHSFDAQSDGELSLSVGDYVVVRQVAGNGWSEGECKGKAGWFPSAYIEQQERAPVNKVLDSTANPSS